MVNQIVPQIKQTSKRSIGLDTYSLILIQNVSGI